VRVSPSSGTRSPVASRVRRAWRGVPLLAAGVLLFGAGPSSGPAPLVPEPCAADAAGAAAPAGSGDLYCIELFPAAGIERVHGAVLLRPAPTPFGVAVTPAGVHVWDLRLTLSGLPDPSVLGPYTTYVAWAMPPQLAPVTRLGAVANGTIDAGRIALDQFIVMVSAEPSADVTERTGRLVLRGISASTRMQPHDLPFFLASMLDTPDAGAHGVHAHHGPGPDGWVPPPMHPAIAMPPALMTLRPDVSPYLLDVPDAPPVRPRETVRLAMGDTFELVAGPVRARVAGRAVTMLGFNGQIPGPLFEVAQGTTAHIRFVNGTDFPNAIHWHGLRLDNAHDGVPHLTQHPVGTGEAFLYEVRFPDAGLYWYHPHHREDVLQDLGLYGNMLVRPADAASWGRVHREELLVLDDLLVGDDGLIAWGREAPTHALMGRFGNLFLVNGSPGWERTVRPGEVVRLLLTNVANTRVFNVSFSPGVRMKAVASDVGRFVDEAWVESIAVAPAERYVVDVRFDTPGRYALVNRVRAIDHLFGRFFSEVDTLGFVTVAGQPAPPLADSPFEALRHNADVAAEVDALRPHLDRPPDRTLVAVLEPGDLPFPLLPMMSFESVYRHPVEWSGTMPEMDWVATGLRARWILRDPETGRENEDIDWSFRTGDLVKLRLINDRSALHAMQHPIHVHGQRFLVLSVNGVPNSHPVWKDTVLLPTGFVVDILLELTNPGAWMLHCHIAEHLEAGMRMVFGVH
jgi:suppressor of ftsI